MVDAAVSIAPVAPRSSHRAERRAVGWGGAKQVVVRGASDFARSLLDLCVPPACPLCGADGVIEPPRLTPRCECRATFTEPDRGWCRGCGAPTGPHVPDCGDCQHCRREDAFPFCGAVSLGLHADRLRDAVLYAKTDGGRPAVRALGEDLRERWAERLAGFDLVAAVPHHWTARLHTSHDPAAELCDTLARGLNLPSRPRLVRKRHRTDKQARLTPTDRRANLRGAFNVPRPTSVAGKRVLLCDDVLTTGTTARRVTTALRAAGASEVFVAVLARGVGGT
ncbi:ComF family protein [Alienimonas chondri]|uniref:Amidophosphoribosyltransferase n=1 Tax=Alienimonas chondri TaxID=2681879 RepID=A0ABX1VCM7_9PLAN|nr:phosphoribosyltransferase family protein [Alienimonas chondri]NNJ25873.1 Amidophosphoribosyltransferase [Alienimonas chondri]